MQTGDPLADLLFGFLCIVVLRNIEADMDAAPISYVVPRLTDAVAKIVPFHDNAHPAKHMDAVYADDDVFMSRVLSADEVLPVAHHMADVVRSLLKYCLRPNPKPDKTELSSK